jgi:hypothetical protein
MSSPITLKQKFIAKIQEWVQTFYEDITAEMAAAMTYKNQMAQLYSEFLRDSEKTVKALQEVGFSERESSKIIQLLNSCALSLYSDPLHNQPISIKVGGKTVPVTMSLDEIVSDEQKHIRGFEIKKAIFEKLLQLLESK